ncbi:MAG TPA: dihydropteroate synthase [Pyrinomonadaceae bacterium]|nr:dihydropteroate synthase [Pyrinomonadaceae bacterium]
MQWKTARREIDLNGPLVMGILNVTPDSFSDGGQYSDLNSALKQAEKMLAEGADILDIGGESTRPGSSRVAAEEEIARVVPIIEAISKDLEITISIDTSKSQVARAAAESGAEIINDISGLRFDPELAHVAAELGTGLVLVHSRGDFETMHSQPPAENIIKEVADDFRRSTETAISSGVSPEQIVLDVGIGFGKTPKQNLELIAKLDKLAEEFLQFPMLIGTSRKSFIGKLLGDVPPDLRVSGSLATAAVAAWNGAKIIRAHDVKVTVEALKVVEALLEQKA